MSIKQSRVDKKERMCEMAQPIYKVWMLNYKDAFYKLSPEEQNKYTAKVNQALKDVGGERVVTCVSVWSSENCIAWGVEKFPESKPSRNLPSCYGS